MCRVEEIDKQKECGLLGRRGEMKEHEEEE